MKKLILAGMMAFAAFAYAETEQELRSLAATPIDQIAASNVNAVVDACIATETHADKILKCRNKGLLTHQQVYDKLKGKLRFVYIFTQNAKESKNAEMIAAAVEEIKALALTEPIDSFSACLLLAKTKTLNISTTKQLECAQALVDAGRAHHAIRLTYVKLAYNVKKGILRESECDPVVLAFCKQNADVCFEAWKNAPVAIVPAYLKGGGKPYGFIAEGGSIVFWFAIQDPSKIDNRAITKMRAYAKAGECLFFKLLGKQLNMTLMSDYVSSNYVPFSEKIKVAKEIDKMAENKNATAALYSKLITSIDKVNIAIYLNDNDKLLDALVNVDESLDAATLTAAITPLNALDANYRMADLKLALMNVNKKYTLKLYDDRDAWEPVISKVRAMLDTLQ